MYDQVISPNTNIAWVNEECLQDVREAFGVGAKFPTAIANWNANSAVNHPGATPPSNISVPIFFSIPSVPDGHVCLWNNGIIITSSARGKQTFSSIQALIAWMNEGFEYLGWSEEIESTPVVKAAPAPAPSASEINLPANSGPWHIYKPGGPYNPANPGDYLAIVHPALYAPNGLSYRVVASLGNGVYRINSPSHGVGDLFTNGSQFTIS